MTTRNLHLFAIGLNVALVAWGAFLIANGVEAGCGLVCGSFYLHSEGYKGPQGNDHWRGCVVLNGLEGGDYDLMPLRMDYLQQKYGERAAA